MSIVESKTSLDEYDSPSWAYRQADRNGYLRCIKEIRAILNLSDQD